MLQQLETDKEITFSQISPFLDLDFDRENPSTTLIATAK
jgi:hypothetical protein